jgi:hypothetical protein
MEMRTRFLGRADWDEIAIPVAAITARAPVRKNSLERENLNIIREIFHLAKRVLQCSKTADEVYPRHRHFLRSARFLQGARLDEA